MPETLAVRTARDTADPQDWAMAWAETVKANPDILQKSPDDLIAWMTGWFANAAQASVDRYDRTHNGSAKLEEFNPSFASAEDLEAVVYQLVGAGSVCWEHMEGTGIFQDDRATKIAKAALVRLGELGVATVKFGGVTLAGDVTQAADPV